MEIIKKLEFENNCWVSLVDSSNWNRSEEDRIKAVTDIASITMGRLKFNDSSQDRFVQGISRKRLNLYNRLLTESAGKPGVPFEFVPIIHSQDFPDKDVFNNIIKYSYMVQCGNQATLVSNYRMVLNQTKTWNLNPPDKYYNITNVTTKDFKVIVGRVPKKVIDHLVRHRSFSWMVESSRNKKYLNEVEFWYPSWWTSGTVDYFTNIDSDVLEDLKGIVEDKRIKPEEATMELSDRRLVHFACCAWKFDTSAWDNLFAVRGAKTGTMSITGTTVDKIKELINE